MPETYVERTNTALDYIVRNLDSDLRLDEVAQVAGFSPYHFHRVFQSLVGETLSNFVKRLRLERALYLMSHTPQKSLTEIALECGFSSSSDFSRSFKARFGSAPRAFSVQEFRDSRREEFDAMMSSIDGASQRARLPAGENPDGFEVEIVEHPARTVAYIRVLDSFTSTGVPDASKRLIEWAEQRGLEKGQWLGYMWDDPEIVALKDCRYDVAVVVDETHSDFGPDGEVGRYEFPPMRVAEVAIAGDIQLEQRAIDWLFGTWLPLSGYEPDDQPAFEAWDAYPFAHGYEHFQLRCQLPIK